MTKRRFNLLPHREIARKRALQVLLRQSLASILVAAVVAISGWAIIQMRITREDGFRQGMDEAIQQKLSAYEESRRLRTQYLKMLQRQSLIEGLDARRSTSVLLMNDVADALPQDVYLVRLEEDGINFRVDGRAVEASAIARFLERLSASVYLRDVTLGEVKTQQSDSPAPYVFAIEGKIRLSNEVVAGTVAEGSAR